MKIWLAKNLPAFLLEKIFTTIYHRKQKHPHTTQPCILHTYPPPPLNPLLYPWQPFSYNIFDVRQIRPNLILYGEQEMLNMPNLCRKRGRRGGRGLVWARVATTGGLPSRNFIAQRTSCFHAFVRKQLLQRVRLTSACCLRMLRIGARGRWFNFKLGGVVVWFTFPLYLYKGGL